jgi:hypothetical protein
VDILSDANGVSLHRFQLFSWTLILGGVFIVATWPRAQGFPQPQMPSVDRDRRMVAQSMPISDIIRISGDRGCRAKDRSQPLHHVRPVGVSQIVVRDNLFRSERLDSGRRRGHRVELARMQQAIVLDGIELRDTHLEFRCPLPFCIHILGSLIRRSTFRRRPFQLRCPAR